MGSALPNPTCLTERSSISSTMLSSNCRRSWSYPFLPTSNILTVLPSRISRLACSRARRTIEALKAPQRPRSAVQTTRRCVWSLPLPANSLGASVPDPIPRARFASHLLHALGKGPRSLRGSLGAAQFRGRHHLHGLGDLLGRLDREDPVPHVLQGRHVGGLVSRWKASRARSPERISNAVVRRRTWCNPRPRSSACFRNRRRGPSMSGWRRAAAYGSCATAPAVHPRKRGCG